MENEELVIAHMSEAKHLARRFESRAQFGRDYSEAESVAMLALVEAGIRFKPSSGVPFWAFARMRVMGALIDALRSKSGRRSRAVFMELTERSAFHSPWEPIDARMALESGRPFLTKRQKQFIDGVLILGIEAESDAEVIGMSKDRYRFHRRGAILRIREVLS